MALRFPLLPLLRGVLVALGAVRPRDAALFAVARDSLALRSAAALSPAFLVPTLRSPTFTFLSPTLVVRSPTFVRLRSTLLVLFPIFTSLPMLVRLRSTLMLTLVRRG